MKLETQTIEILQNFANINPNLVVKEGKPIDTINDSKTIYATSTDVFDVSFGIYNLSEFLSVYELVGDSDVELSFSEKSVKLTKDGASANYRFADANILTHPQKQFNMPSTDVSVLITNSQLNQIRKAAGVLKQTVLSIIGESGKISAKVCDPKNSSANSFELVLDTANTNTDSFEFHILIPNLKVLSGDYTVELSKKFVSHWVHATVGVQYFIALEKTSTYNA